MNPRRIALRVGIVALGAVATAQSSVAQRVSADIHIGSGPVDGVIRIGDRPDYRVYGRPRRMVVERRHGRWNSRNYRNAQFVVVFYDRDRDLYFDRYDQGLDEVRVFQDGGQYYRYDSYDGYDGHDGYDGYDNYDRGERWGRYDWGRYDRGRDDRDRDWGRDRGRDRDRDDRNRYDRRDDKNRDWYYERNGRYEQRNGKHEKKGRRNHDD